MGANMMSAGDIEQTIAETAYCNSHETSLHSSLILSPELLDTKREKERAILRKSRSNIIRHFATKEECFDLNFSYDEAERELADLWARKIGLKTLDHLCDMLETTMYDTVEKFWGIISEYATHPMAPRQTEEGEEEERSAIYVIKAILRKFLTRPCQEDFLEHLEHYAIRKVSKLDAEHLTDFVTSRTGNVLHLRKCSFAADEVEIWE